MGAKYAVTSVSGSTIAPEAGFWPVTSWSSIDYYGNPKVFHEWLKTLYAPVLLSLDRKDHQVFVTSDLLRNIEGMLMVTVYDLEDHPLFEQKVKVEMNTNENRKYYVEGLHEFLLNADPNLIFMKLELTEGENVTAERKVFVAK